MAKVNVNVMPEDLKGRYANATSCAISAEEVCIDFLNGVGEDQVTFLGRFFLSLPHARRFLLELGGQLDEYEARYGKIVDNSSGPKIVKPHGGLTS